MDKVIFTESQVVLDGNQRIYIRRRKDETESPNWVCPPAQQKIAVMIWGCITWYGVGTINIGTDNSRMDIFSGVMHIFPIKLFRFKF